ncbi:MAG: TPR end-of-group domain-containing protein [Pirellulaceae bacterium]
MVNYQRMRRQQSIREAEGYLDLATGFADQWPLSAETLSAELRARLAQRALDALAPFSESTGQRAQILYLNGLAYRAMHRYAEAVPHLKAAAELDPDNIVAWLALGWCYKRIDHLDDAIRSLESALATDQREAIIHYNLACYWSLTGDADRALSYLSQSFDIDPQYRELVADESDFDPIRSLPDFQALMGVIV